MCGVLPRRRQTCSYAAFGLVMACSEMVWRGSETILKVRQQREHARISTYCTTPPDDAAAKVGPSMLGNSARALCDCGRSIPNARPSRLLAAQYFWKLCYCLRWKMAAQARGQTEPSKEGLTFKVTCEALARRNSLHAIVRGDVQSEVGEANATCKCERSAPKVSD